MAKILTKDYSYKIGGDVLKIIYDIARAVEHDDLDKIYICAGKFNGIVKNSNFEAIK